ncbi:MAG: hypothetical protein ACREJO_00750 [Phycisphaerales bacterium]
MATREYQRIVPLAERGSTLPNPIEPIGCMIGPIFFGTLSALFMWTDRTWHFVGTAVVVVCLITVLCIAYQGVAHYFRRLRDRKDDSKWLEVTTEIDVLAAWSVAPEHSGSPGLLIQTDEDEYVLLQPEFGCGGASHKVIGNDERVPSIIGVVTLSTSSPTLRIEGSGGHVPIRCRLIHPLLQASAHLWPPGPWRLTTDDLPPVITSILRQPA